MNGINQHNQWFCYMDLLTFTHQEYEKRINEWRELLNFMHNGDEY